MKMRKNGLVVDAFATLRIPIPSPRSTKKEVDPRCAAPPPERRVHRHPAVAVAVGVGVGVAVGVAEPEVCEQKGYKTRGLSLNVPVPCVAVANTRWDANANALRLDVARNDHGM